MNIGQFNPKTMKVEELKGGTILKKMNECLAQALANCADPAMKQDKVREVNFKLKLTPNKNRNVITLVSEFGVKLVSVDHITGAILMEEGSPGIGVEFDPNQMEMFEDDEDNTDVRARIREVDEEEAS